MKASEMIEALKAEMSISGDPEITVYCPIHSGENGDPVGIHGFGWFVDAQGNRSTFIDCYECHADAVREKIESDAMDELGLNEDPVFDTLLIKRRFLMNAKQSH